MKILAAALTIVSCFIFTAPQCCAAPASGAVMSLPAPRMSGGMPLMDALKQRRTDRDFSDKAISAQTLSNLLWATWGINRDDGRRTAPTAMNKQRVELYVAKEDGVWHYDAGANTLSLVLAEDSRPLFKNAPLTLLIAVPRDDDWGSFHAGALTQNAGLFCASEGLANVVKGSETDRLKGRLALPSGYGIAIVHSIGWPGR